MNAINKVEEKKAEIENYKRLIDEYGRGRWYWKYRRRLEELETELEVLIAEEKFGA